MESGGAVDEGATSEARAERLRATVGRVLGDRPLIVAANRGPLSFTTEADGSFSVAKGAGGVVTALQALERYADPVWVVATLSDGDRARAAEAEATGGEVDEIDEAGARYRLRFVAPDPAAYDRYYNTIANPLLWFLQHYLWDLAAAPNIDAATWTAWREGYVPVNRLFAEAVVAAAAAAADERAAPERRHDGPGMPAAASPPAGDRAGGRRAPAPVVLLHDYHLYLCARLVRERLPAATIQHFVHVPWPAPDYWRILPGEMRRAICDGLLGADIVGFQAPDHARNFLATCAATLPGVAVDDADQAIVYGGRRIAVRVYPISLDTAALREAARAPATARHLATIRPPGVERLIVRTDRAEPSKNILRGFEAYRRFLERYPEWRGRVTFLALLNPSRLGVPQYADYLERIHATVEEIGGALGTPDWQPIALAFADDYARALAALRSYDVLLANSLADGMNLVAKEGPLVNERDGALILSEGTGAFAQLGEAALAISPCDIEGTAAAFHDALTMPPAERARRAAALRAAVEREDVVAWFQAQLDDLDALDNPPARA